MNAPITVREVDWQGAHAQLSALRTAVFIREQGVPPALEWDGREHEAHHLLALIDDRAAGCARILPGGSIGRMAVLADRRGQGVGTALLHAAIRLCVRHGWHDIHLSAQTHAIGFYQRAGFTVCGEEYQDAGIAHRDMRLSVMTADDDTSYPGV